jgi:hypothetical protein
MLHLLTDEDLDRDERMERLADDLPRWWRGADLIVGALCLAWIVSYGLPWVLSALWWAATGTGR